MNSYDNIVYKMLMDKIEPNEVYCRILALGYSGALKTLVNHIQAIAYNHFNIKTNIRLGTELVKK